MLPCRPSNVLLLNLLKMILRCRDPEVVLLFLFAALLEVATESVVGVAGSRPVTSSAGSASSGSP